MQLIMNDSRLRPWSLCLAFLLAGLIAAASFAGLFIPSIYSAETRPDAARVIGNDAGNLMIAVPILVISAILANRGSLAARLVWTGTLVYYLYVFAYYSFALHFNSMFLAYCGILGISFYLSAGTILSLPVQEIARRYSAQAPARTTAVVLLLMTLLMAYHWTSEIIPGLLAGQVPQAIPDSGNVTEPVAVLDLAFGAPACLITGVLLLRREPLGFTLGPVLLTFLVLSSLLLVPVGLEMNRRGFAAGWVLYAIALGLAAAGGVLLALSMRECRTATRSK